jgi:hypothetical protein
MLRRSRRMIRAFVKRIIKLKNLITQKKMKKISFNKKQVPIPCLILFRPALLGRVIEKTWTRLSKIKGISGCIQPFEDLKPALSEPQS